ncbi:putative NADPH-quinone reductase [Mesorhizobium sangaii]|uniref:Putative NADPH-quinone reductase n=1 Tax=Mesorhizobium sangaii TaxID=505389 RepID=A0A841PFD5_9HYPH|nr:putative NADPH-quinone reductase [Mesorhizobium sangaii]
MPSALYRLWFLGHGIAGMRRSILRFVGISPVRETLYGMVAGASDATRAKWISQMRSLGERAL